MKEDQQSILELAVDSLTCRRGGRILFHNLSFSLTSGQGLLLLGANGAGKTSLLRILAGYLRPDRGIVALKEDSKKCEFERFTHYVGHRNGIKAQFSVQENLQFWRDYLNSDNAYFQQTRSEIRDVLKRFNLWEFRDIPANLLSAGQKRRLCLARLLIAPRPLWLLDEPSHALDRESQALLAEILKEHINRNGLVVATTHIPLGFEFDTRLTLGEETVQP